jgi:hypothetical protein
MARVGVLTLLFTAALVSGPLAASASAATPETTRGEGSDSPWPNTNDLGRNIRAVRKEINKLAFQVELMEESVARYENWETCLDYVPVSEYGDPWDARFGYLYDERDGTGIGHMDAIAVDPRDRKRRSHYQFIDFVGEHCRSAAPLPGGTAEPASLERPRATALAAGERKLDRARPRPRGSGSLKRELGRLERQAENLFRRAQELEIASERFDEWESCVSWVPVTERGSADGIFGYQFGGLGASEPSYRAALHVDRSDWDDPDYMFLALVGGDRPGRECQDEPGEAVD